MNPESVAILMIVSFSLALVVIMKRESIPVKLRRPLALLSIFMVAFSFALMVYIFFNAA